MIRHLEESKNICSRILPNENAFDEMKFKNLLLHLQQSLHLNLEWKKYPETKQSPEEEYVTIQSHHLNAIASCYGMNIQTTGIPFELKALQNCIKTNKTLEEYGLSFGQATGSSKGLREAASILLTI